MELERWVDGEMVMKLSSMELTSKIIGRGLRNEMERAAAAKHDILQRSLTNT